MQSFEIHSQDEIHSQNDSLGEEEEERDESSDEFEHRNEWVDGGNFPFHEVRKYWLIICNIIMMNSFW